MEKFVEKFNIFDLFTTLIPGIIISSLLGVSLSFKYNDIWNSLGGEKYILFFVFSYVCGLFFQELGTIFDDLFMYKILFGGKPREIFLLNDKYKRIFRDSISYRNALKIKQYIIDFLGIDTKNASEKEVNSLVFTYCLNICEMKGLTAKADKMIVISEMSRSLFWGCIFTIIINLILILFLSCNSSFLCYEILFLIVISLIFLYRKRRYEQYRSTILLRYFLIFFNIK